VSVAGEKPDGERQTVGRGGKEKEFLEEESRIFHTFEEVEARSASQTKLALNQNRKRFALSNLGLIGGNCAPSVNTCLQS